jgi:hypothetical protein
MLQAGCSVLLFGDPLGHVPLKSPVATARSRSAFPQARLATLPKVRVGANDRQDRRP